MLCIAALCAYVSMLFIRPCAAHLAYIGFRTLGLLFYPMSVVLGFDFCGLFGIRLAGPLPADKTVMLALVLFPFFASMLIINVVLITFIPFAL